MKPVNTVVAYVVEKKTEKIISYIKVSAMKNGIIIIKRAVFPIHTGS